VPGGYVPARPVIAPRKARALYSLRRRLAIALGGARVLQSSRAPRPEPGGPRTSKLAHGHSSSSPQEPPSATASPPSMIHNELRVSHRRFPLRASRPRLGPSTTPTGATYISLTTASATGSSGRACCASSPQGKAARRSSGMDLPQTTAGVDEKC